ncbi:DNA polymerase III subunit alpha [Candidatus Nomurabacteria bacterium]|nr:MAG: DNA polymerase III subunit alpha [Candidatus Nomurabacteria bacterium]
MSFVHLHTHSHYSLLDGLTKIDDLVKTAKAHGMNAVALTDHGSMYGAIEFYKACKKEGIKPIIGVEAYIAERTRFDKDPGLDSKRYHLTLLAKNEKGYRNLMKLVSRANLEGFYYKPRMDKDLLKEFGEGIICLSGCPGSEFVNLIKNKHLDRAKDLLKYYIDTFGRENVFVEVMKHDDVEWYTPLIKDIVQIAEDMDLPIVGTWDSHYLHQDDAEAQDTLVAINTGSEVGDSSMSMKNGDYSFISDSRAREIFRDIPGAYDNTAKVADMVDIEISLGEWVFPKYEIPEGTTYDEELRRVTYEGFASRNIEQTPEMVERVEYELEIIKNKGYSPYFLVVSDLLRYARENNIISTTRGSAAGSFVSYLNFITTVDPIHFKLPFERFLNPFRPSPPDIDMDIADNRRDDMISYAKQKYGTANVAQIGTFGTMMARGSVRDVARALGYSYSIGDRLSKMIPMGSQGMPMTIDKAFELVPELKSAYENERETKEIIDLAKKMEGCARHISVHAAGVVVAPTPVEDFSPIQFDPKGDKIITQYDMYSIEEAGLLKLDFLGIRNLAILGDAIERIKKIRGITIDLEKIPYDDKKTFEMLARGETVGVFQLSGDGMTVYVKDLKPTCVDDLNAMVALYRPGPMETIPEYIKRKNNPELISYPDPRMEKYLKASYGLIVYQDDLLFSALELAGYNWEEADKFRKAVGKKIPAEMAAQKQKLIKGIVANGQTQKFAETLWKLFEPFQAYGFNKAHAASYGKVAYQTAYMKANYPAEYMSSILTAESDDLEKVAEVIDECKRMGFVVLPPDINESFSDFTVVMENGKISNKIRFGLNSIKNFGEEIGKAIIHDRKEKGPFTSLANFLERVHHRSLNKKSLEALIKSGAMDIYGDRGELLGNMEILLAYNKQTESNKGQESLFGGMDYNSSAKLNLHEASKIEEVDKLAWEKEFLGLYISGHPLEKCSHLIEKSGTNIKEIIEKTANGFPVTFVGMPSSIKTIITKKNEKMAFMKIIDLTGSIEAVVFSRTFEQYSPLLLEDKCLVFKGKVSIRNNEKSILLEAVKLAE